MAAVLFVMLAPAAMLAFPLSVLLFTTPPRSKNEVMAAALAGGFSLAWLIQQGTLPDQTLRAGVVIAGIVFALFARYTASAVIHRSLVSIATAALAIGSMLYAQGSSWRELSWWVERDAARSARMIEQAFWAVGSGAQSGEAGVSGLLRQTVQFVTDYHPAIIAVQMMAALALATAIYQRITTHPRGTALQSFWEFRFNENTGWLAIGLLAVVLTPGLDAARPLAANVLLLLGALYALRGLAVAATGLRRAGLGRGFTVVIAIATALLILPIALAGAILLGIVDSRIDLRRRWASPQASR